MTNDWQDSAIAGFEREPHARPDGIPGTAARTLPLQADAGVATLKAAVCPAGRGHVAQSSAHPLKSLPTFSLRRSAKAFPVDQGLQRRVAGDELPQALQWRGHR